MPIDKVIDIIIEPIGVLRSLCRNQHRDWPDADRIFSPAGMVDTASRTTRLWPVTGPDPGLGPVSIPDRGR